MVEVNKNLLGLLIGIARHDYYRERDITDEVLKEELFSNMTNEEYSSIVLKIRGLLKSMAATDMDVTQAEAFLISQTKKREGGITEDLAKVFVKFWKQHKSRIHESLIEESVWSHRLKGLSWRVDVKTRTKSVEQLNVPCAIVEMQLENRDSSATEVVRFEVDESNMSDMIKNLNQVEELIAKHCIQSTDDNNTAVPLVDGNR